MTTTTTTKSKRIAPQAYEALAEALAVIHWNKQPYETYLPRHFHDHPELLARLDFTQTKWVLTGAGEVIGCTSLYEQSPAWLWTE
jgi:hypothetical protein